MTLIMPLVIAVVAILMPVAIVATSLHFRNMERQMIHRERMLAMEKGLQPPVEPTAGDLHRGTHGTSSLLFRGLILLFVGLGALGALYVSQSSLGTGFDEQLRDASVPLLFVGIITTGIGLAHLVYYAIESQKPPARPPMP
jgi:hypothetical protein